jgi:hypothetical protein
MLAYIYLKCHDHSTNINLVCPWQVNFSDSFSQLFSVRCLKFTVTKFACFYLIPNGMYMLLMIILQIEAWWHCSRDDNC